MRMLCNGLFFLSFVFPYECPRVPVVSPTLLYFLPDDPDDEKSTWLLSLRGARRGVSE